MIFEFAGNKRIIESVNTFIGADHIPHAIIIEGDEGLGKHTLADYIAKSAVCTGNNKPCDNCRACTLFNGQNHPDVIFVSPEDKKKSITVAQIRTLRTDAHIKAHMQGKKVFILNKCESLSEQSQNALLKILEEPPKDVIFILITESEARLLNTIISRCVTLSLVPPETDECLEYIKKHTKKDNADILSALSSARNNIGKALTLLGSRAKKKSEIAPLFADALIENRSTLELLQLTVPLEKNRVAAAEFISELKQILSDRIRANTRDSGALARLFKMRKAVCEAEPQLITNINLPLFFSALIYKLKLC